MTAGKYFGKTKQQFTSHGMIISTSFYPGEFSIPLHHHQNPHLCYFLKGGCRQFYGRSYIDCGTGELIQHPKLFEHHNNYVSTATQVFHIEFDESKYAKLDSDGIEFHDVVKYKHHDLSRIVHRIMQEIKYDQSCSPLMIESLIMELLIESGRKSLYEKNIHHRIKKAMQLIQDEYNQPLHTNYLASVVEISVAHLSRQFKKETGVTMGDYQKSIRMEKAMAFLKNSKLDIYSIAIQCGFSDLYHFSRIFTKHAGISPFRFRMKT